MIRFLRKYWEAGIITLFLLYLSIHIIVAVAAGKLP